MSVNISPVSKRTAPNFKKHKLQEDSTNFPILLLALHRCSVAGFDPSLREYFIARALSFALLCFTSLV